MRNIELKVLVDTFDDIRERLAAMGALREGMLSQEDTYFTVQRGRLKLREINNEEFQLIYYERPDESGSKTSEYEVQDYNQADALKLKFILSHAVGVRIIITKKRELWLHEHTRIHLDSVTDIGKFLELETVVADMPMISAENEHKRIIDALGLSQYKKCSGSYSDMLG